MANATDEAGKGSIGEVEAVCAEIVSELREMVRAYVAHRLADGLIPQVTDPRGHELTAALTRMGEVSGEVDALLAVPVAALRVAVSR